MRTFTDDETGEKFELLAERIDTWDLKAGALVIKPIKAVDQGATEQPRSGNKPAIKQVDNLSPELTFEQQQEITEILEAYRANPSNSNKHRYHLFAYIDGLLQQQVIDLLTEGDHSEVSGDLEAQS